MAADQRLHYMDNLRAIAMLSGVLFHAALAYSPLTHPYIPTADRAQSEAVDACIWFLHLFRMPLFFLVAGFFTAMLVARRGVGGMFRNRMKRIALPFVVFVPITYSALKYSTLQAAASARHPSPVLAAIRELLRTTGLPEQLPGFGHLWFLYYLLIFYLLVWSALNFELEKLANFVRGLNPAWVLGLVPLLLVPSLASVSAPSPAPESFLPQFWAIGFFGAFFAFGYLVYGHDAVIARLRSSTPFLLAGSLALYGVFWYLIHQTAREAAGPFASWPIAVVEAYISVWMTVVSLIAGRACLDRSNKLLRYFADASYWTYLVHLPILFAIQYWMMDLELGWGSKFAISVLATFAICLLSYQALVRRTVVGNILGVRVPATT